MHRVLAVYEIVSNILQNAERYDQAMAARVSRLWADIAPDWLWRELDSVLPLLRLLSPLAETSAGLGFAEKIEPRNWERFRYYARRVRRLSYDDRDFDPVAHSVRSSSLASDVSLTILALKPSGFGALLPNVQEINWGVSRDIVDIQHVLPFLNGSLRKLALNLGEEGDLADDGAVARFFNTLSVIQGLSLETFDLDMVGVPTPVMRGISSVLRSQPKLKFSQIRVIGLGPKVDIAQDLLHRAFPESLQGLSSSIIFQRREDYLTRAETIVQRVPHLRSLELHLVGVSSWWPYTLDDLAPFMALPNLEELVLVTLHGFQLDPDDIAALGKAFPKMTRFDLQPQPQLSFRRGIQATSLIDFSNAFPNLRTLSMYIVHDPLRLPWRSTEQHSQAQPQSLPSFNSLTFQVLDVGSSFLEDKDIPNMAELLSVLCRHPSFEIKCEGSPTDREDPAYAWRKVETLVKLVQEAERDITKPYHEWCRALIMDNLVINVGAGLASHFGFTFPVDLPHKIFSAMAAETEHRVEVGDNGHDVVMPSTAELEKPSTSPLSGKLVHQARAPKEITETDLYTTGWDSAYSTKPLRTNPPHWGDIPNRAPAGRLEQWIWRKRLWVESTFILIVLEPWEKLLVCE
ncbi:hypothetical protein FRC00_013565 [Tulasnella sp. 408]|nr:hypothetical protein FRC00_013565 [Tulasnella sp. 408]